MTPPATVLTDATVTAAATVGCTKNCFATRRITVHAMSATPDTTGTDVRCQRLRCPARRLPSTSRIARA